jgi:hypothetical protein
LGRGFRFGLGHGRWVVNHRPTLYGEMMRMR